jgi:hypothetical protein
MKGLAVGFFAFLVLVKLSIIGLVVWAAVHFISKYW